MLLRTGGKSGTGSGGWGGERDGRWGRDRGVGDEEPAYILHTCHCKMRKVVLTRLWSPQLHLSASLVIKE